MATAGRATSPHTLDDLAKIDPDGLMALYQSARTPRLEDLDGKLVGRMLAVPRLQQPHVKRFLDRFARSGLFPWQGKTFSHETADHGHGVNRLLGERVTWFRFHTSIGPSHAGDFDAVHLDYGQDGNPPLSAQVKTASRQAPQGSCPGLANLRFRTSSTSASSFGAPAPP